MPRLIHNKIASFIRGTADTMFLDLKSHGRLSARSSKPAYLLELRDEAEGLVDGLLTGAAE